ncbi:MAG: response regulator [Candidatus Marinimicrobia bacterium]|nr:response regulator [Candidatus Neomarinimicrobiota bacterium]
MDDNELIRLALVSLLNQLGYETVSTSNGAEAIMEFEATRESRNSFDLCILDLTVPGGMGGKEASEQLLELDPDVKLIVASGYADEPIMAEYRKYGFIGVLVKPFTITALTAIVQKSMDSK